MKRGGELPGTRIVLAALAGLVLADRAAQRPVPWSGGACWVGGTCLVLAAGLLLAGLLLRRRWLRHERISAISSAAVIREAGRAYHCWFAGHGLLWIGLPLLAGGLLLRGLGSQLPVLVLVAGAATAAVHSTLGLTRRPAPGQLLGLCWQLLTPAPGSVLAQPVTWTEAVVSSRHRLATARRLDRSRAGQHRPLFRQMQDVLDLETVLPRHRRLRLTGGLSRPVGHELLVRSLAATLLLVIGMVVTVMVLALQAGWAALLPPGAAGSRIVFARHAAPSPVATALVEPTPTPTPAPGGGAQEQPSQSQEGASAPSSQEAVAPGPGQARGSEESADGVQGIAGGGDTGNGGAGGQRTGGDSASGSPESGPDGQGQGSPDGQGTGGGSGQDGSGGTEGSAAEAAAAQAPGGQPAGGSASQSGSAGEDPGAEGTGMAEPGGQQAAPGQGEAGGAAGNQAGVAGGQGAGSGSGAEAGGTGQEAGITAGAGGAGDAGAGGGAGATNGAGGASGAAGTTGGEPGQGSAGSGGQPGGGGSGESADGAPGTSGVLGQAGGGLAMDALAPPAPDQLVTVELPILGMTGPDSDRQPTPAPPMVAGEQAGEPLPQPTVPPPPHDNSAATDKEPRQPLPAWVQQILEPSPGTAQQEQ